MMTIRKEQLVALQVAQLREWIERLSRYLKSCFPDECNRLGSDQTRQIAQEAIYRAREWGFVRECDVAGFAAIFFFFRRHSTKIKIFLGWPRSCTLRSNLGRKWIGSGSVLSNSCRKFPYFDGVTDGCATTTGTRPATELDTASTSSPPERTKASTTTGASTTTVNSPRAWHSDTYFSSRPTVAQ